ncbi:MAG: endonuclease/exonuclease/phosphatase family protein, partial [Solirubrobacteraceae bacterium]
MRIVSLNLRAYFGPGGTQAEDLAKLIASHQPDVALLQEARPRWLNVVCRAAGLTGTHSVDVAPQSTPRRGDGCVIAVRPPLRIERVWRVAPSAFAPALVAA